MNLLPDDIEQYLIDGLMRALPQQDVANHCHALGNLHSHNAPKIADFNQHTKEDDTGSVDNDF